MNTIIEVYCLRNNNRELTQYVYGRKISVRSDDGQNQTLNKGLLPFN